jgi:hypothetical protein
MGSVRAGLGAALATGGLRRLALAWLAPSIGGWAFTVLAGDLRLRRRGAAAVGLAALVAYCGSPRFNCRTTRAFLGLIARRSRSVGIALEHADYLIAVPDRLPVDRRRRVQCRRLTQAYLFSGGFGRSSARSDASSAHIIPQGRRKLQSQPEQPVAIAKR